MAYVVVPSLETDTLVSMAALIDSCPVGDWFSYRRWVYHFTLLYFTLLYSSGFSRP
jgi:hypothetical protein